jgi:hypothetical protein
MDLGKLSRRFEKLSVTARLQDTAYFMRGDEATRIQLVQAVLERLDRSPRDRLGNSSWAGYRRFCE